MSPQILRIAHILVTTEGAPVLDHDTILGVYRYLEIGRHESAFMISLRQQAEVEGQLSLRQLTAAANILRGRFKHYLRDTGQVSVLQDDGSVVLEPVAVVLEPQAKVRKRRSKSSASLTAAGVP